MSAEYAMRMDALQRQREELAAQRQAVEKRIALREATAAEFSAVALQSCKQKLKSLRTASQTARKRNDEFVRALHAMQKQTHEATLRNRSELSSATALLAQEKARYYRKIEQVYPAWQEQLQRLRVEKLRVLEDKKRAVERRRYLAKKTFEKEKTLEDLIRQTRHEIEMSENLEQNELYERELLRTQSTTQANEINHSIREHAEEARSYLREQAAQQLEGIPEVDAEISEKLYEAFSPRSAVRALQEGSRPVSFEDGQQYQEEDEPVQQIRVEIPTRMQTPAISSRSRENQRESYQPYSSADAEYACDDRYDYEEGRSQEVLAQRSVVPDNGTRYGSGVELRDSLSVSTTDHSKTSQCLELAQDFSLEKSFDGYNQSASISHQASTEFANSRTLKSGRLPSIPEIDTHSQTSSDLVKAEISNGSSVVKYLERQVEPVSQHATTEPGIVSAAASSSQTNVAIPLEISTTAKQEEHRIASSTFVTSAVTAPLELTPNAVLVLDEEKSVLPEPTIQNYRQSLASESASKINQLPDISSENTEKTSETASAVESSTKHPDTLSTDKDPVASYDASSEPMSASDQIDGGLEAEELQSNVPKNDDPIRTEAVPSEAKRDSSSDSNGSNTEDYEAPHDIGSTTTQISSAEDLPLSDMTAKKSIDTDAAGLNGHEELSKQGAEHHVSQQDDGDFTSSANGSSTSTVAPVPVVSTSLPESTTELSTCNSTQMLPGVTAFDSTSPSPDEKAGLHALSPLPPASKSAPTQSNTVSMTLKSMNSDDFNVLGNEISGTKEPSTAETNDSVSATELGRLPEEIASSVTEPTAEEATKPSPTERLSPADQVKALGALIARVEEGADEGDTFSGPSETGASHESKRELIKMAVSGRKAQIAFFGSDICFELLLDISRDLGPVLFPPKAFEGIMNDQKIRKLHQHNKERELELWKLLSAHMKQLVHIKAIAPAEAVDAFVSAFLAHDPENQRSRRKLREFISALCGSKSSSPRKENSTTSPSPPKQEKSVVSPDPVKKQDSDGWIGTPTLLQTAFLQRQSPPKQPKTFGIASSSFKTSSNGSSDVLLSMGSTPTRLSHKLMRGGKMADYSEFEEEEEVDLQNLIGTKPAFGAASTAGRQPAGAKTTVPTKSAAEQEAEDDDFDMDF